MTRDPEILLPHRLEDSHDPLVVPLDAIGQRKGEARRIDPRLREEILRRGRVELEPGDRFVRGGEARRQDPIGRVDRAAEHRVRQGIAVDARAPAPAAI